MAKVKELRDFFNTRAPFYTKFDFDNIGFLIGFAEQNVRKVLLALDITDEVIEEAIDMGAEVIVSHHPLIFEPLKKVTDDDDKGRKIIRLIQAGVSAICLHTNLDTADGGVNDALMAALGARVTGLLDPHGSHPDGRAYGVSRLGELAEAKHFDEFLTHCKAALKSNGLRYHYAGKAVQKIACCGGAGGSDMQKAYAAGCDTYITADLKYDHFLWAKEHGLNLIDGDHYCTENVVIPVLQAMLKENFPDLDVQISLSHKQVVQFF